jgi:uncharacterized protein YeeX (DUF496 family)
LTTVFECLPPPYPHKSKKNHSFFYFCPFLGVKTQISGMEQGNRRGTRRWVLLLLALLVLMLLTMVYLYSDSRRGIQRVLDERVAEAVSQQRELDSLTYEYESIKRAYGSLNQQLRGKDSVIQQNIQRINQLISSNARKDMVIRELEGLRGLKQDYERRLDSLMIINLELTDRNLALKHRVDAERERNLELTEEREEFRRRATLGERMRAYNISAGGFRTQGIARETATDRARRTDRIKVCFTIGENLVVPPGEREVYVRVARPDNVILALGSSDTYMFTYQGERLQYSMKQFVNYQNRPLPVCLSWDKILEGQAMAGVYHVSIFLEEQEIGKTSFELF